MEIIASTGTDAYVELLRHVLNVGEARSPRNHGTIDAGLVTLVVEDVRNILPLGIGRNLSTKIAAVEALQLIGGFSDSRLTVGASTTFARFLEPDLSFHGAYGNRISDQIEEAVRKITTDQSTRQAVITLWDPLLDNEHHKRDYPCTVALVLSVVRDKLCLTTFMRSQDCWWGTPYDLFQFTQLQQTVARVLDLPCGPYTHVTNSTHIYTRFIADAFKVSQTSKKLSTEFQPSGFGHPGQSIVDALTRAWTIGTTGDVTDPTPSEAWYITQRNRAVADAPDHLTSELTSG